MLSRLNNKIHWIIVLYFLFSFVIVFFSANQAINRIIQFSAQQNASALNEAISAFRSVYTRDVVDKIVGSKFKITHLHKNRPNTIPLPATMSIELGKAIGLRGSGSKASLYSPYPFPWREHEGGLQDSFQKDAWEYLLLNPNSSFSEVELVNGQLSVRYARADKMMSSCVGCHNSHPDSPKTDWEIGDVRGLLEIVQPIDTVTSLAQQELGGARWFLIISTALGLLGILVIVASFRSQITKHQELEKTLLLSNDELNKKIEELDQFSYRSSHDLKAPLISARGLANFIETDIDDGNLEEAKSNARRISQQMETLETLVSDLLALAKADVIGGDLEPVDIERLLSETHRKFSNTFKKNNVNFRQSVEVRGQIISQRSRITQIFENLIYNSVKYCDQNKLERFVEVRIVKVEATLEITITDNGIGIPEHEHQNVFTRFKRFHPGTAQGSGLGMAIVKNHVDRMGGQITFTSSAAGTSFQVVLPVE